jgi:hypothetical protein
MNVVKHNRSRVRCVGLAASTVALAALLLTLCAGNRNLGFGRSISETEQSVPMVFAGVSFVGRAGRRSSRSEGSTARDEVANDHHYTTLVSKSNSKRRQRHR